MTRSIQICGFAALLLLAASQARAQDFVSHTGGYYDSYGSELDALRADYDARLADMQRQLDAMATAGGGGCGGSCCDPCCRTDGWFGSAQAIWLKPHHADGTGFNDGFFLGGISTDYEVTPRLELGYARCDGLGVRVRYWEFDHAYEQDFTNPTIFDVEHGWDTWVGDIEVTDSTRLGCNWDATFSVGFRYVEYDELLGLGFMSEEYVKSFEGYGLTASAELRRCLTCNWGLFANVRASALYGDEDTEEVYVTESKFQPVHQENNVKYIWEAQAGIEWKRPIDCCGSAYWYARGFGEVQYWDSFGMGHIEPGTDLLRDTAVGFAGFGVALGMVR